MEWIVSSLSAYLAYFAVLAAALPRCVHFCMDTANRTQHSREEALAATLPRRRGIGIGISRGPNYCWRDA